MGKRKGLTQPVPTGTHCIEINYNTGDSFSNHDGLITHLDYSWTNIEIALENLKRIREHYVMVEQLGRNSYPKGPKEIHDRYKRERWYSEQYPDFCLMLLDNEEKPFRYSASSWCGYFESLNSARIVTT